MLRILCRFRKCNKIYRKCTWFRGELALNLLREFLSIMTRINVIGRQRVKSGSKISEPTKRDYAQLNLFDINRTLS